jgi:hypothetical protein
VIGLIVAAVGAAKGDGFKWYIVGRGAIVGTLFGFSAAMQLVSGMSRKPARLPA